MANATKISNEKAKEILTAQFSEDNKMTIEQCAKLLGKHRNTISKLARASVENKRNGMNDPNDFPAMQTEPHSPYIIFFNDLKIWFNRMGMRI